MKVINVITPHFTPEITAAAHRMDAVVNSLSSDYRVNVFTLTERGKKAREKVNQIADNITVHSINLPRYTKKLFFIRAIFELYYSVKLCRKAFLSPADLTLVTSPYMFLIPVATYFKGKGRMIADVRDLVWCYLPQNNWLQKIIRENFEKIVCRSLSLYDHVTVTNKVEKDWLLEHAQLDKSKLSILSNGISSEKFDRLTSLKYHRRNSPFVITYVGNIGNGQDLQPLIDTVKGMKDVMLNVIGDGIEYKKFSNLVRNENIGNIHLHGKLKWSRVLPFYQSSSLLYARLGENYDSAIPSKLYEYLSTGLPVVFHGSGFAKEFLMQFENTFFVKNDDPESLKNILAQLGKSMPEQSMYNRDKIEKLYLRENINENLTPIINKLFSISSENTVDDDPILLVLQEDAI